ncbi:hypothetical protein [Thalassolituus hydrocarboniclasticus]|uniref:Cytochrome c domain-containing protein n=1 Tax=Thalassolituus hydrocarboniclasticus TaxID=2742796 RepID=A0ABY6ABK9_9GAMM|nr:hypothetical protein [Thalassolituus hydrocarboniclasticus]UXD87310.1 hypothetical protein HUF19_07655 [Thalassolituus hydrocarboniclasticus]
MNIDGRLGALFLLLLLSGCGAENTADNATDLFNADPLCQHDTNSVNWQALQQTRCPLLSQYGLFKGLPSDNKSSNGGMYYKLGSELFTDHARKYRYIFLPQGTQLGYQQQDVLDFPTGSVIVKVFAMPTESTTSSAEDIMEVRLLVKRSNGWVFIPYVWDNSINDARLATAGSRTPVSFSHNGEQLTLTYESPSQLTCQICHQIGDDEQLRFGPIGPKIRHLNQPIEVNGQIVNQLQYWQSLGIITLPAGEHPYAPNWRDTSAPLQQRAKAYLDINCAHCHNDNGSAALSGLRLEYWRNLGYSHGICNSAHGWRGGGFDIWPGRGDDSSLPLRMELNGAADRMPPIGRSVADDEAVALIRAWIDTLPAQDCASG